jgi:tetratricopeptide (TPR) repeat protein
MADVAGDISILNFIIWFGVIAGVLGIGMGAIAAAYFWPTGRSVVFETPTMQAPALNDAARDRFQKGCAAFQAQQYRRAIQQFSNVLAADRNCAEAFHNLGLTFANLGDDQAALKNLLQASDLYDQQGDKDGLDTLMQDLATLRQQRQQVAAQ